MSKLAVVAVCTGFLGSMALMSPSSAAHFAPSASISAPVSAFEQIKMSKKKKMMMNKSM